MRRWPYRMFMMRELTAVFLALYMVMLLLLASRVHTGEAAFAEYEATARTPLLIAFHLVVLASAVLHTVTWFQAVPKGLPLRRGEERVPAPLLIGANYALMLLLTLALVALLVI
jgi:fumarate reductase subunit C